MEEMKANLTVLWNHAIHLKILELLLTKKELHRINHHQFDKDVMNGSTLLNFRTAYAYLELDWPLPLHLTKIDYTRAGEFLSWSPEREWFDKMQETNEQQFSFEMPIISPMFPEQNLANRIDAFEAKKIQNEFLNAIKRIKAMNAGAVTKNESLKENIFN
ncbi:hypothetical protein GPALN_010311 [Globodera pallida]|nr:hypothetical protein GPALN_010311 [Globodera pallida]